MKWKYYGGFYWIQLGKLKQYESIYSVLNLDLDTQLKRKQKKEKKDFELMMYAYVRVFNENKQTLLKPAILFTTRKDFSGQSNNWKPPQIQYNWNETKTKF